MQRSQWGHVRHKDEQGDSMEAEMELPEEGIGMTQCYTKVLEQITWWFTPHPSFSPDYIISLSSDPQYYLLFTLN